MAVSVRRPPTEHPSPAQLRGWTALCPADGPPRLITVPPGSTVSVAERPKLFVIFDGVLHDRNALAARLQSPPDASDADVVADGWSRTGSRLLDVLSGFYAIVVVDRRSGEIACARDRLGIHPLFYAQVPAGLVVSPSTNALAAEPAVGARLNRALLADNLSRRSPGPQETYYEAVRRVPSGHVMQVSGDRLVCSRYWDPAPPETAVRWADDDELERFDPRLDQAVERCLALGPSAIYLSGGLDSISVAAVATDRARSLDLPDPVALSLLFREPESNEEEIQREVARQLGLRQLMVSIEEAGATRGLLESVLEISAGRGAPVIGCWLPGYRGLGLRARELGCRTILTGGGGDEWLAVTVFLAADLIRSLDVAGLRRLGRTIDRSYSTMPTRLALWRGLLWTYGFRPLLRSGALRAIPPDHALMRRRRRRRASAVIPEWVAPDPALREQLLERAERAADAQEWSRSHSFYLQQGRISLDHAIVSMEMEETFENGRSMDMRVLMPYWDPDLVDLLYRVPPQVLNRGERAKALVRQTLAKRFQGLGLHRQRKVIASRYFTAVMLGEGRKVWERIGGAQALAELGVVEPRRLDAFVQSAFQSDSVRAANRIWNVLNLESWVRQRIE